MNTRGWCAVAVALLLADVCVSEAAPVNTNGNLGVARALSARPLKNFKLNVQLGVNYSQESDYVLGPVDYGSDKVADKPFLDTVQTPEVTKSAQTLSGNFSIGIGLAPIWDLALSMPLYYDWPGFGDLAAGGIGDPEITTKICAPPAGKVWYNTLHLGATIPVGTQDGYLPRSPMYQTAGDTAEAGEFHTWDNVTVKAMLLSTLDFTDGKASVPFAMHLNAGILIPFDGSKRYIGIGSFALEYTPAPPITIFADFTMEKRLDQLDAETFFRDPMYVTPGFRINTPAGLFIQLAFDACLSSKDAVDRQTWTTDDGKGRTYTYSTAAGPTYGVQFALGWRGFLNPQDSDKDGIMNNEDNCPKQAEDVDGYQDADGCPDLDNDSDGKPDSTDKCPGEAEDDDGFADDDGCPDPDNDKDGIVDEKDKCPNEAEDFDGYEDKDGCRDPDNDKDGVADSLDRCPNDPEDFDQYEDNDGCADIDNDKDGIPDLKDKCPNQPETFNEVEDADGCPDVKKKESQMPRSQILRGINFQGASAVMMPESYTVLEPLLRELTEYPDVEIEVRGHTDASGKAEANMRLAQTRAEAILQYLSLKGINATRMRAVGYGASSPIADNRNAAGRAQNRRIEIVRLK